MHEIKGAIGNSSIVIEKSDTDLPYLLTTVEPDSGELISKYYCKSALDAVRYSIKGATTRKYPNPEIMLKVKTQESDIVLTNENRRYEIHVYSPLRLIRTLVFRTLDEAMGQLME